MKNSNMKVAREWGNGSILARRSILDHMIRRVHSGASGSVLKSRLDGGFCLKLVRLLDDKGKIKNLFWQEAKSVSLYTSAARNIPGCVTCPIPARYWIHEDDPVFKGVEKSSCAALDSFITLFRIEPEQLQELSIDPGKYRYIPAELLNSIYKEYELSLRAKKHLPAELHKEIFDHKIKADILLTYPVLNCCVSLENLHSKFEDANETARLIYQILSAILELYRNGLAHGDIKPANIMTYRRRRLGIGKSEANHFDYFLTDIGSLHSGSMPSDSGTEVFIRSGVYKIWQDELKDAVDDKQKKALCRKQNSRFIGTGGYRYKANSAQELNSLLRRTLMDGFALAVTVWSLAYGQVPRSNILHRDIVAEKWNNALITEAFNTLYDVNNLSIAKMQKILDALAKEFSFPKKTDWAFEGVETYGTESEFKVDVQRIDEEKLRDRFSDSDADSLQLEYGHLQEQFNISGSFNPVVRCSSSISRLWRLPKEVLMQPFVTAYSNGRGFLNNIYYAPDDAVTGSRIEDFTQYIPHSLDYDLCEKKLDDASIDELSELGRVIDKELEKKTIDRGGIILPYPRDIVKVDGQWKLQPFFLNSMIIYEQFSMEEYFKMLCGRKNALTAQNWLDLIYYDYGVGILYNLIPQDMVRKIAELINTNKLSNDFMERNLIKELRKTKKFGKYLKNGASS